MRWAQLYRIQALEQPPSKPSTVTILFDAIDTEVPEAHDLFHTSLDSLLWIAPHPCWCVPCCKCNRIYILLNRRVCTTSSAKPSSKPPTSPTSSSPLSLLTLEKRVSKKPNTTLHEQPQEKQNCIAKALYDFLNSSSLLPLEQLHSSLRSSHQQTPKSNIHTYPLAPLSQPTQIRSQSDLEFTRRVLRPHSFLPSHAISLFVENSEPWPNRRSLLDP